VVTLTLFTFHGSVFTALKTTGEIRERARGFALKAGVVTALAALAFLIWTQVDNGNNWSFAAMAVAVLGLVGALVMNQLGREGWAFILSGVTIVAAVAMLFLTLFPDVMPSSLNPAWSLTVSNASASDYTLKIMTWVAGIMTPVVLVYQGWTYWVFRRRIGVQNIPA
jgi:cytochrome d ubiquinol oxidase subunit II